MVSWRPRHFNDWKNIYCAIFKLSSYFRWNHISFVELVTAVPAGSRLWDKGGGYPDSLIRRGPGLQTIFFRPFGPQFSLKIRGGRAPRAPPLDLPLPSSSMRINASYLLNAHSWTPKIEYKLPMHLLDHLRYISSGGGGGHSLILPVRVCAAEQGMVFRVLSLKQGI